MKPSEAQFKEVPSVPGLAKYDDLPSAMTSGRGKRVSSGVKVRPEELGATGLSQEEYNRASTTITEAAKSGMAAERGAAIVHNKNLIEHTKGKKANIVKIKS